jgi:hypothetical protein
MKHVYVSGIMHFFLYHLLPIIICLMIFSGAIYLMLKDAKKVLKDKEDKRTKQIGSKRK